MFKHARIVLDSWHIVHQSTDAFAPVGHLHPVSYHLEPVTYPAPAPKATPGTPAQGTPLQQQAPSRNIGDLQGQAGAASTESYDSGLYRLKGTQLTAGDISSAAAVIEVPPQAASSTLPEPTELTRSLQLVTPAGHSTAAWAADVQLQCGAAYARAVCCPCSPDQGPCDSTGTAAALEHALSAVQQGQKEAGAHTSRS